MDSSYFDRLVDYTGKRFEDCERRIIGSEDAFRSAVVIPFFNNNGIESILFEKRAANIRQGGEICFPGGMVDEEDGNSIETVVRETEEETGITRDMIEVHGSAGYMLTTMGAFVDVYMGRLLVNSMDVFQPNPDEVEKLFSIPVDFFMNTEPEIYNYRLSIDPWFTDEKGDRVELFPAEALGLPERYWNSWSHTRNRFVVYRYDSEVIWGLTARIMYSISKMLKKVQRPGMDR